MREVLFPGMNSHVLFLKAGALGNSEFLKLNVVPVSTIQYGISKAARPFNSKT